MESKSQMNEHIFSHDVTKGELKLLFIPEKEMSSYISNTPERKMLRDLYILFKIRGDEKNAMNVLQKIGGS
jgi:hypothetical protein